jgi:uncharacterized protein YhbP (UPF0306 family)
MTIATAGPVPRSPVTVATGDTDTAATFPALRCTPHAASVFYAVDTSLRLIFLSKPSSLHGAHIGDQGPVAVTIAEQYEDWEAIRGVQLWGEAHLLQGASRVAALAIYLARFPFVEEIVKRPEMMSLLKGIGVYRVAPCRWAFTDNTTGVFGREVLDIRVE